MINLDDEIEELYEKWLLDSFPEEIRNKDDLINKSCDGYKRDTFNDLIIKNLWGGKLNGWWTSTYNKKRKTK